MNTKLMNRATFYERLMRHIYRATKDGKSILIYPEWCSDAFTDRSWIKHGYTNHDSGLQVGL